MASRDIRNEIIRQNHTRMKYLSILLVIYCAWVLIADYSHLYPWSEDLREFYKKIDIAMGIIAVFSALFFSFTKNKNPRLTEALINVVAFAFVGWAVLISGHDFNSLSFSTYIAALVLAILFLNLSPLISVILIWGSSAILIFVLYHNGFLNEQFYPHLYVLGAINAIGTIVTIKKYYERVHLVETIIEKDKLAKELQEAHHDLESEIRKQTEHLVRANEALLESRAKLKTEKDRFASLIDHLQAGVFYINTKGDVLEVNKALLEILGSPSAEATKAVNILNFQPLIDFGYSRKLQHCIDTGEFVSGDGEYITKWGKRIYVVYYFVPIFENDALVGILGYLEDQTEKHKADEELRIAKQKAEESDRLKTAFLANMSHEIRTPMNGILGFSKLLMRNDLTDDQYDTYINIINSAGNRLLNTINDIVDISRIDAGEVIINNVEVNISKLVSNLTGFFKEQCNQKGLELELEAFLRDKELLIHTDEVKLNSIFTNLIKNAIKYTDSGKIVIGGQRDTKGITFYVRDTGIGIPKDRHEAIFQRFTQADIEDRQAKEGSGLGLAIVKEYLELLGGKIWLESEPGKGSTFYFTIPLEEQEEEKEQEKEKEDRSPFEGGFRGMSDEKQDQVRTARQADSVSSSQLPDNETQKKIKVIIAEDDAYSAEYLQALLEEIDAEVILCMNGEDAITACKENPDTDIILMDIKMPVLNGFEASKKIREFNDKVKIIFQTAHVFSEEKNKAFASGADGYISKPIDSEELLKLMLEQYNTP